MKLFSESFAVGTQSVYNMEAQELEKLLNDPAAMADLIETINKEMADDDEPFEKKGRHLLMAYMDSPKIVDDVLISLCGWSMETLLKKSEEAYG